MSEEKYCPQCGKKLSTQFNACTSCMIKESHSKYNLDDCLFTPTMFDEVGKTIKQNLRAQIASLTGRKPSKRHRIKFKNNKIILQEDAVIMEISDDGPPEFSIDWKYVAEHGWGDWRDDS